MLLIMFSAIQGWSAGTCSQRKEITDHMRKQVGQLHSGASRFKTLTWDGKQILGECEMSQDLQSGQLQESSRSAGSCRT